MRGGRGGGREGGWRGSGGVRCTERRMGQKEMGE